MSTIRDDINPFGYAPDFVPFPALDASNAKDTNAFEVLRLTAWNKVQFAKQREEMALSSDRSFETSAAAFQAELTRIRNTYENQLAELCGTFEVNGVIYPNTKKYNDLNPDPKAALFGDPCGWMGGGGIHAAIIDVQVKTSVGE